MKRPTDVYPLHGQLVRVNGEFTFLSTRGATQILDLTGQDLPINTASFPDWTEKSLAGGRELPGCPVSFGQKRYLVPWEAVELLENQPEDPLKLRPLLPEVLIDRLIECTARAVRAKQDDFMSGGIAHGHAKAEVCRLRAEVLRRLKA